MKNKKMAAGTVEAPASSNELLNDLAFKWEMASYLDKIMGAENPFKTGFNPPAKIAKKFYEDFNGWLASYLETIVDNKPKVAQPTSVTSNNPFWSFSDEERALLKNFLSTLKTKMGRSVSVNTAPHSKSVRTMENVPKLAVGQVLYLMDGSIFNNPDVMSGDAVRVTGLSPNGLVSVRLENKPQIVLNTTMDNLSKENM